MQLYFFKIHICHNVSFTFGFIKVSNIKKCFIYLEISGQNQVHVYKSHISYVILFCNLIRNTGNIHLH